MICEGRAEGSRAWVSWGRRRTPTSAIFHSSETDLLQTGPCRLFSAVLGSVAAGCVSSWSSLGAARAHGNCWSLEASRFDNRAPNSERSLLSSQIFLLRCYPHFKATSVLGLGQGCLAWPALWGLNDMTFRVFSSQSGPAEEKDPQPEVRTLLPETWISCFLPAVTLDKSFDSPGRQFPHSSL